VTRLEDLLERAAQVESVSFDSDAIRAAARRRRARNRAAAALSTVVLVAAALAGWMALGGDDDRDGELATDDGSVAGVDVVGLWELLAVSEVRVVEEEGVYLEFDQDGSLRGFDGCNGFSMTWSASDGHLLASPSGQSGRKLCPRRPGDVELIELLLSGPQVGTFSGEEGTLQLSTDDRFVAFARVPDSPLPGTDPSVAEQRAFDFLEAVSVGDWAVAANYLESSGGSPVEFGADIDGGPYADTEIGRVIRLEPALADARDLPGLIEAWCTRHGGVCSRPLQVAASSPMSETRPDRIVEVDVEHPAQGTPIPVEVSVGWFEGEWHLRDLPGVMSESQLPDRAPDVRGVVELPDGFPDSPQLVEVSDNYYLGMSLAGEAPVIVRGDGGTMSVSELREGDRVAVWTEGGCRESNPVQCDVAAIELIARP
jgi:heat shock protein HslJ